MKFALTSLIANPQNNFRLFVDKVPVPDAELNERLGHDLGKEKFIIDLLVSVLGHPFETNKQSTPIWSPDDQPCEYHFNLHKMSAKKPLSKGSVLRSILDVQRLDEIGSIKAFELYNHFRSRYVSVKWFPRKKFSNGES